MLKLGFVCCMGMLMHVCNKTEYFSTEMVIRFRLNPDLSREEEEPMGTLCQCAHYALTSILPTTKLTSTLTKILLKDRSESLSRVRIPALLSSSIYDHQLFVSFR